MKSIPSNSRIFIIGQPNTLGVTLKKKLEKQGHNVMLSCDCRSIFDELIEYDPHVILLDVEMSAIKISKLLRKLARSENTRHISVIFVSDLDTTSLRTLRTAKGLYSTQLYLVKSAWTLSALLKKINRELKDQLEKVVN